MKITNNYSAVIVLPPDVGIAIGGSVEYPNWGAIKDMPNIAWRVEVGHLVVEESEEVDGAQYSEDATGEDAEAALAEMEGSELEEVTEPTQEEVEDALDELSDADEKEALIYQLAELGVKSDKRSSVETLQQKLDEELAK